MNTIVLSIDVNVVTLFVHSFYVLYTTL